MFRYGVLRAELAYSENKLELFIYLLGGIPFDEVFLFTEINNRKWTADEQVVEA